MNGLEGIGALTFDVFGTVVDWRSSIIREGRALGERLGLAVDWEAFADDWRGLYHPSMEPVRTGERPWVPLDRLHRESLDTLAHRHGFADRVDAATLDALNLAWHRLDPWPDSAPGLTRLRRRYPLATLSNGNVALMVDLARHGGLPFDAILGAELARQYKPRPEVYLRTAEALGLAPEACLMVAAHNHDLKAAARLGLRTAYVIRPTQSGPAQTRDLGPEGDYDLVVESLEALADALGC
jgi:2-haloacid dehalogenase